MPTKCQCGQKQIWRDPSPAQNGRTCEAQGAAPFCEAFQSGVWQVGLGSPLTPLNVRGGKAKHMKFKYGKPGGGSTPTAPLLRWGPSTHREAIVRSTGQM